MAPSSTRRTSAGCGSPRTSSISRTPRGSIRAGLDAFAHGVRDKDIDDELVAMFKQRPNLILTPNLPDRGVKTDLSWMQAGLPAADFEKLEAANTDRPQAQAFLRHSGAQPGEAECGGRAHHARNRRQPAVGAARGDGRHGDCRNDADAGHRGGDAQLGRVPADPRRGHAGKPARAPTSSCSTPTRSTTSPTRDGSRRWYLRGAAVDRAQPVH